MGLFHHRTDDEGDAQDEAPNGNEGHVAGAFGSLGGIFTPSVVKDAETLIAEARPVVAKADAILADVELMTDWLVRRMGLKK